MKKTFLIATLLGTSAISFGVVPVKAGAR
jgi:hypothetical protein